MQRLDLSGEAGARRVRPGSVAGWVVLLGLAFAYYWLLLSDGRFLGAPALHYGTVFNSMIEYMARGEFDVDPATIRLEGWTREGRVYAYFGILPALLRLPILAFPSWRLVDFTTISCAVGATLALAGQWAALAVAARNLPGDVLGKGRSGRLVVWLTGVALALGGPQVQYLRPSIFQESLFWGTATASLFLWLAVRWCLEPAGRRPSHLVWMAVLAGLCLLARVSTSIALYGALGAILLVQGIAVLRDPAAGGVAARLWRMVRQGLPAVAVLFVFVAVTGYVNYMRWGSPLTFQDYRYYNTITADHPVHEVIRQYGYFNLRRIPFGFFYYFVPLWVLRDDAGMFIFHALQARMFFTVEFPPGSLLVSDAFLCVLAWYGVRALVRPAWPGLDRPGAGLAAVGLALPGLLMLMALAATFRYRMEFYPFLVFAALLGMAGLARGLGSRPSGRARGVLLALVGVSVVSSHVLLVTYKIAPWDDAAPIQEMGWRNAYVTYFSSSYPSAARMLGRLLGGP